MKQSNDTFGRGFTWLLSLLWLISFVGGSAQAQLGVGVSPPNISLTAAAGSELSQSVMVDHPGQAGDGQLRVSISVEDVLLNAEGNPIFLPIGSHPRSLGYWMTLDPLEFVFGPQDNREVRYDLAVPDDLEDGSYWGIVLFLGQPLETPQAPEGVNIISVARVGHVLYVNVGELERKADIVDVHYLAGGEPQLAVTLQNNGNAVLRLEGRVEIRDADGMLVAQGEILEGVSFPGYSSDISSQVLNEALPAGDYVALTLLNDGHGQVIAGETRIEIP